MLESPQTHDNHVLTPVALRELQAASQGRNAPEVTNPDAT
jgi:hypothetical protein